MRKLVVLLNHLIKNPHYNFAWKTVADPIFFAPVSLKLGKVPWRPGVGFRVARADDAAKRYVVPEDAVPPIPTYRFKPKEIERLNAPLGVPSARAPDAEITPTTDVIALMKGNRAALEGISPMPAQSSLWKRSRRLRCYCAAIALIDTPLAVVAYHVGHTEPFPFVSSISGMALFSSWFTWKVWALRV